MAKQVATINRVQWSPNDERAPGLHLEVDLSEGGMVGLTIPLDEIWSFFWAYSLISSAGIRFADLKGKSVWVEETNRMFRLMNLRDQIYLTA